MGIGTLVTWLIFLVIAYLVYKGCRNERQKWVLMGISRLSALGRCNLLNTYLILREGGHFTARKTTPQELLDERYAKGELTREQYMQMEYDLKKVK